MLSVKMIRLKCVMLQFLLIGDAPIGAVCPPLPQSHCPGRPLRNSRAVASVPARPACCPTGGPLGQPCGRGGPHPGAARPQAAQGLPAGPAEGAGGDAEEQGVEGAVGVDRKSAV